jgi:hypothetical protein
MEHTRDDDVTRDGAGRKEREGEREKNKTKYTNTRASRKKNILHHVQVTHEIITVTVGAHVFWKAEETERYQVSRNQHADGQKEERAQKQ